MEQIDGYGDLVEIGRGGFSIIYRARQLAFDREVAVKVVHGVDFDKDAVQRFQRERLAVGGLSWHPRVVTVYDAGVTTIGRPFIAMELMDHGSLLSIPWPAPWPDVLAIGVEVSDALEAAHQRGVLHRDIKPENVLRSSIAGHKLADFGIAKMLGGAQTATGMFTGTVSYAAPELFDGRPASPQSDVYSTGALLFALLAGQPPFRRASDESALAEVLRAAKDPVPDLRANVPDQVASLIERAMAKDPADRPASAAEFIEGLWVLQDGAGLARSTVYWPHGLTAGSTPSQGGQPLLTPQQPYPSPPPDVRATAARVQPPTPPPPPVGPPVAPGQPPKPPKAGKPPKQPKPPKPPGSKGGPPIALIAGIVVSLVIVVVAVVVLTSGGGGKKKQVAADDPTTTRPKATTTTTVVPAGRHTAFTAGELKVDTVSGIAPTKAQAKARAAADSVERLAGGGSNGNFTADARRVTLLPAALAPSCLIPNGSSAATVWRGVSIAGQRVIGQKGDPSTPGMAHLQATVLGTGKPSWTRADLDLPCQDNQLVAGNDVLFRSGDADHPGLVAIDGATGKTAWSITATNSGTPVTLVPADVAKGVVYLRAASAEASSLMAVRMVDGHVLWGNASPGPENLCDVVRTATAVQVLGCDGTVLELDAKKGAQTATASTGAKGFSRFIMAADGQQVMVLSRSFGTDGNGQVAAFTGGTKHWSTSLPGKALSFAAGPNARLDVLTEQPRTGEIFLVQIDTRSGAITAKNAGFPPHHDHVRLVDGPLLGLTAIDLTTGTSVGTSTLQPGAPFPTIAVHANPDGMNPVLAGDGAVYIIGP